MLKIQISHSSCVQCPAVRPELQRRDGVRSAECGGFNVIYGAVSTRPKGNTRDCHDSLQLLSSVFFQFNIALTNAAHVTLWLYPAVAMFRWRPSHSNKVGPLRRVSILNTLAASGVINNAAGAGADADAPLVGAANPLFNDTAGSGGGIGEAESKDESVCMCVAAMYDYRRLDYIRKVEAVRVSPAHLSICR